MRRWKLCLRATSAHHWHNHYIGHNHGRSTALCHITERMLCPRVKEKERILLVFVLSFLRFGQGCNLYVHVEEYILSVRASTLFFCNLCCSLLARLYLFICIMDFDTEFEFCCMVLCLKDAMAPRGRGWPPYGLNHGTTCHPCIAYSGIFRSRTLVSASLY